MRCDLGFVGLGVMGKNLTLNLIDNGFKVACYDIDQQRVDQIMAIDKAESQGESARVTGCLSYTRLLDQVEKPRVIILSVPAGDPVDHVCEHLIDAGIGADDIVVDTGNSLWTDSVEREQRYKGKFIFFSTAISGGEHGARFGASLMPSGDPYAWTRLEPIFHAIAAKVDEQGQAIEHAVIGDPVTVGEPCAAYIGPAGAGHFVKMVHNGIEYADMQLICEAYHFMRESLGMQCAEIAACFEQWNESKLNSYLMAISAEVLRQTDPITGVPLVDVILDTAGQKGTGLWTAISALEAGAPTMTITQAVFARSMSSFKQQRLSANQHYDSKTVALVLTETQRKKLLEQLVDALYCAKICVYAQGFQLMMLKSAEQGWRLNCAEIAKIWRAGCIIRARFLQSIAHAFEQDEDLEHLLLSQHFMQEIKAHQEGWREAIINAVKCGVPIPAMSSALAYFDSFCSDVLPANLLQAQRDYFGAHTFERVDQPRGKKFHLTWNQPEAELVRIRN